ncbi:MAG: hypothetical protein J7L47_00530, partial [Candidatus Odinarchaeota archaeon]|nr:hypothetical protein [Candidatus Odinarchaeota archaeon]
MKNIDDVLYELIKTAIKRRWHLKYAKYSIEGHQTLLAHALVVTDVGLKLAELLNFNGDNKMLAMISCFLHDIQKETKRWQDAVKKSDRSPESFWQREPNKLIDAINEFLKDIVPRNYIQQVIDIILVVEGIESAYHEDAMSKSTPNTEVSYVVQLADILSSLKEPNEIDLISNEGKMILKRYNLKLAYHSVDIIRGISTQLLHKGIAVAYSNSGYVPILYFPTGTIYIG